MQFDVELASAISYVEEKVPVLDARLQYQTTLARDVACSIVWQSFPRPFDIVDDRLSQYHAAVLHLDMALSLSVAVMAVFLTDTGAPTHTARKHGGTIYVAVPRSMLEAIGKNFHYPGTID